MVPEVPYRIADLYGSAAYDGSLKYMLVLREPVARAISSWFFKFDRELCSFVLFWRSGMNIHTVSVSILLYTALRDHRGCCMKGYGDKSDCTGVAVVAALVVRY